MGKKIQTLNIGAQSVTLAEYEVLGKNSLKLLNYGVAKLAAPLDSGNASAILSPALLEIVREKGIRPGQVALSVSGQMVFPKFAAIPFAGGQEKFDQMIRYEIEQNIPFPLDEMVCDSQILGDTETGDKSVMIVASKLDQLEPITSAIMSCGFSPMVVSAAPLAVANALSYNLGGSDDCVVILDIGAKTTNLIITEGEKFYNRSVPVAGNSITKEISQVFGCTLDEAEALKLQKGYVSLGGVEEDEDEQAGAVAKAARSILTRLNAEVNRSINFYRSQQGGGTPTKLYITGGVALMPQIDTFFSNALGIEVEYLNPFERIQTAPSIDMGELESNAALLAASAGLAVQASASGRYNINLLPPAIIADRKEKARIPVVIAASLILIAAGICFFVGVQRRGDTLEAELSEVETRASALTLVEGHIKKAQAAEAEMTAKAAELKALMIKRGEGVDRTVAVRTALGSDFWVHSMVPNESKTGIRATIRAWKDRAEAAVKLNTEKNGTTLTAAEIVRDRFARANQIPPESISQKEETVIGPKGEVKQFVLEHMFK